MRNWLVAICGSSLLSLAAASDAGAAATKINGVTYTGKGSAVAPQQMKDMLPPDQSLRMKKLFLFPSIDDLSGALAPKLDEKLFALFSKNTRFEVIRDPLVVKALSPDESSYFKAAVNQDVHREAAKVTSADTTVLLRTRNLGPNTQMTLEARDANGNLLFSEEGAVPGSAAMDVRWGLIEKLYKALLARVPFEGAITGRTANTLTVDLGMGALKQGQEIEVARIVSVQRHPLLGTITGTDYVRTGRARVTTVDRVLSFAEVIEEFTGEKISPGQKVLQAQSTLVHRGGPEDSGNEPAGGRPLKGLKKPEQEQPEENPLDDRLKGEFDRPRPRYGAFGVDVLYGSLLHSQTVNNANSDYGGSGIGGDVNGELWVTKNWIFSASYGLHNATLEGSDAAAGTTAGATTWNAVSFAGGFRLFPDGMAEGLVITGNLGYQSMNFDVPANATQGIGPKKYAGILVRADGEIFFLEKQKINVSFTIQPFSSVTETGPSLGTPNRGTVIGLKLGWNRQLSDDLWLRVGIQYDVANASYEGSNSTISDKHFAFGPGIYYSF